MSASNLCALSCIRMSCPNPPLIETTKKLSYLSGCSKIPDESIRRALLNISVQEIAPGV
jgi:hypothetical protein